MTDFCATYAPLPLDRQASLETGFADLHHSGALPERLGIEQLQPELAELERGMPAITLPPQEASR